MRNNEKGVSDKDIQKEIPELSVEGRVAILNSLITQVNNYVFYFFVQLVLVCVYGVINAMRFIGINRLIQTTWRQDYLQNKNNY